MYNITLPKQQFKGEIKRFSFFVVYEVHIDFFHTFKNNIKLLPFNPWFNPWAKVLNRWQ
ncbi:hypothetical protein [Empedobacter brevis]|uniref:hypothetical protein n=1 Tax=Empedobacter brevis TaxID=247 RepID=UPI0023EFCA14|nr:hypothetical protein [Empedobacter brevis]